MSAPLFADDYQLKPAGMQAGAERNWKYTGGALFFVLLAAALGFAATHLLDPRTLPVRHVRINGEFRHLSPASLQDTASDVVRGGFFNVNVDAVRAVLLREPWVRDVTVRRVWPDSLSLHVTEQVPVARWSDAALLNADAERFAPERSTWPDGLPLISGPDGAESLMLDRYRYIEAALAARGLGVARLDLDERRSWSLTLEQGPRIILGRREYMNRFDRYTMVLPGHILDSLRRIEVMDMRYTNGFAVRWRDAGRPQFTTGREDHGKED